MHSLTEQPGFEYYRYAPNFLGSPEPGTTGHGIYTAIHSLIFKPELPMQVSGSSTNRITRAHAFLDQSQSFNTRPIGPLNLNHDRLAAVLETNPYKNWMITESHTNAHLTGSLERNLSPYARIGSEICKILNGPNIDIIGELGMGDKAHAYKLLESLILANIALRGGDHYILSRIKRSGFEFLRLQHLGTQDNNGINIIGTSSLEDDDHINRTTRRRSEKKNLHWIDGLPYLEDPYENINVDPVELIKRPNHLGALLFAASKTTLSLSREDVVPPIKSRSFDSVGLPKEFAPLQALHTAVNFRLPIYKIQV